MSSSRRPKRRSTPRKKNERTDGQSTLRVVGGKLRGRQIPYSGDDDVTRPMKDRTREALFNLLGPTIKGATVIDWFAGTGALAIESISRGATRAVIVERHIPTFRLISKTTEELKIAEKCEVVRGDTFFVAKDLLPRSERTVHFFSPPYDLFVDQESRMVDLIRQCAEQSPTGSDLVIESDQRFDFEQHFDEDMANWRQRKYSPAVVVIGTTT